VAHRSSKPKKKVTEAEINEANASRAHIFHHLTGRGFEYSPLNGNDTYHHPSGHSVYVGSNGESWWHEKDGKPVAHGGAFPGHKAYDSAYAHVKRLTDTVRSNEITHPKPEKKADKVKKKVTEKEINVGMTSHLPRLKPRKIIEDEECPHCGRSNPEGEECYCWQSGHHNEPTTFSNLRKKLEKEDIDNVRVPDTVPDFDMAEKQDIVPEIGLDDRLYTETEDENDRIVPADMAVSGRSYTL
jgi:hypothetical protein